MIFKMIVLLCMEAGLFVLMVVTILASSILFSALRGKSNLMGDLLKKRMRNCFDTKLLHQWGNKK